MVNGKAYGRLVSLLGQTKGLTVQVVTKSDSEAVISHLGVPVKAGHVAELLAWTEGVVFGQESILALVNTQANTVVDEALAMPQRNKSRKRNAMPQHSKGAVPVYSPVSDLKPIGFSVPATEQPVVARPTGKIMRNGDQYVVTDKAGKQVYTGSCIGAASDALDALDGVGN